MQQFANILKGTRHLATEVDALRLGVSDAEVVFVGRSNAGKSSLVNALCQKTQMARVSQVPGKTRTINVYEVRFGRWIVDLPGYGYAIGSRDEKEQLGPMIEGYLQSRENLRMVFVVVDSVAGPTRLDLLMMRWLSHHSFPFSVIVNKIDKIASPRLKERQAEISAALARVTSDICWISTRKMVGTRTLQERVTRLLTP